MIGWLCFPDSTPSDNSLSPMMDDSKVDDDIMFTSPNKMRTTEDLFAMIHRFDSLYLSLGLLACV